MTIKGLFCRAKKLTECGFTSETVKYQRKQLNKIHFHLSLDIPFARRWSSLIQSEEYKWVFSHRPRVYSKPFRVHISTGWKKQQRMNALLSCYAFMKQRPLLRHTLEMDTPVKSTELTMKYSDERGQTYLGYNNRYRKEGGLMVPLHCDSYQEAICEASFLIDKENEDWVYHIGRVQGNKNTESENAIKELRRQMYALRSKALMILIIQELSRQLGCTTLYGVGSKIQAHNEKHFIHIEWLHELNFSYDTLWKEADGTPDKEGWFKLPIETPRKSIEEIKSGRRSLYRNRYEMLDKIAEEIQKTINK